MYKKLKLSMGYSYFLALLPILNLYHSGISVVTLGEVGLIIYLFISIILMSKRKEISIGENGVNISPIIFFIAIFFLTCLSILSLNRIELSVIDIIFRFVRLLLWAFSISFTGYLLFHFESTKRLVIRVSIVATVYILVQLVFWQLFRIYLPSVVHSIFLSPASEGYADVARLSAFYANRFVRPASFFGEPAYYSYYVLIGLVLVLFQNKIKTTKKAVLTAWFLSLGVIVSTSTAGIYLMILVWSYYIYKLSKQNDFVLKIVKNFLLVLPFVLAMIFLFIMFSYRLHAQELISNLQVILSKPFEFGTSSRLGGNYNLFNSVEGIKRFIGVGFGNEDTYFGLSSQYLNSSTILLLSSGYIGLLVFFIFAVRLLFYREPKEFILALLYVILCFSSSILYSSFSILYLSIILYSRRKFVN